MTSRSSTRQTQIWTTPSCSRCPSSCGTFAAYRCHPAGHSCRHSPNGSSTTPCCSSRLACTAEKIWSGSLSHLTTGRLDAVWGSRRLSLKDIEASYRLRYHHNAFLRSTSYLGSHLLSAAYLVLFGRYISDTLSGVRGVRAPFLTSLPVAPDDKLANQYLLSALLADRADVLETPVQFLPLSPERVRRTTPARGRSLSRADCVAAAHKSPSSATPASSTQADLKVSPRAHS